MQKTAGRTDDAPYESSRTTFGITILEDQLPVQIARSAASSPGHDYPIQSKESSIRRCRVRTHNHLQGGLPSAIAQLTIDNQLFGECYASEVARKTEGDGTRPQRSKSSFLIPYAAQLRRVVNMARICCFQEAGMPRCIECKSTSFKHCSIISPVHAVAHALSCDLHTCSDHLVRHGSSSLICSSDCLVFVLMLLVAASHMSFGSRLSIVALLLGDTHCACECAAETSCSCSASLCGTSVPRIGGVILQLIHEDSSH